MTGAGRVSLSLSVDEGELVEYYRLAIFNEQQLLHGLLTCWPKLSPAQRGLVYRVADAFASAAGWRGKGGA